LGPVTGIIIMVASSLGSYLLLQVLCHGFMWDDEGRHRWC